MIYRDRLIRKILRYNIAQVFFVPCLLYKLAESTAQEVIIVQDKWIKFLYHQNLGTNILSWYNTTKRLNYPQ